MAALKISLVFEIKYLTVSTAVDCSQTGILLLQSFQMTHYRHLRKTKMNEACQYLVRWDTALNAHVETHRYRSILESCLHILSYTRGSHSLRVRATDVTIDKPIPFTNDHFIDFCTQWIIADTWLIQNLWPVDSYLPLSRAVASSVMASPCARIFAQTPSTATLWGDDLCSLTSKGWWHRKITRLLTYIYTLFQLTKIFWYILV